MPQQPTEQDLAGQDNDEITAGTRGGGTVEPAEQFGRHRGESHASP